MGIVKNKLVGLVTCIVFLSNIVGCAKPYLMHPEFIERHKLIQTVAIMPPEVDAYVLTFQGDKKRLHDLIPIIEETTFKELVSILEAKGYEVKKLDLSETVLETNPDLRTALFNVRKIFTKSLGDILKHKQKKFTYSLGSDTNIFADVSGADVLIFVKEEGIKKSAGEIAKDVVKGTVISAAALLIGVIYIPIPRTAATVVHIAVVDSNDGAILWYTNNLRNPNWDPENQKHVSRLIANLFKPFPDSVHKDETGRKNLETKILDKTNQKAPSLHDTSGVEPVSVL